MRYNVKINLNELPWTDKEIREVCLSEIEKIALESDGFIEGWKDEILPPYLHFVALFENKNSAFAYANKIIDKEYVGRAAIEKVDSHYKVMEAKLPKK